MAFEHQKRLLREARAVHIEEMRAEKMTYKAIAIALGISRDRVRQLVARGASIKTSRIEAPNASALSTRAQNALVNLLQVPDESRSMFDRTLPQRASSLTRRDLDALPYIGAVTIAEIEVWLTSHGLKLADNPNPMKAG